MLHEKKVQNYLVYLVIFLAGYLVELIGVNTNYLFGSYTYGDALGIKILNVPPLIGLNWLIIIISGASIARTFFKNKPIWFIAIISAIICTLLDVIIEPVAIKFDFWSWDDGSIPIYNYVCWLVFSFLFSLLYLRNKVHVNKIGVYTYGVWVLFFTFLNII
jgi:putative membrane protein